MKPPESRAGLLHILSITFLFLNSFEVFTNGGFAVGGFCYVQEDTNRDDQQK